MKKDLTISYNELMSELDSFRQKQSKAVEFTKQQIDFIKKCRNHISPVPYSKMCELWEKLGWGSIGTTTMSMRCKPYENKK